MFAPGLFVVLWSTGFIVARYGTQDAGPLTFLTIRTAIAAVILFVIARLAREARMPQGLVPVQLVVGVGIHAMYLGGVFVAIDNGLPSGVSALIAALHPVVTTVLGRVLLSEVLTRRRIVGVLLGSATLLVLAVPFLILVALMYWVIFGGIFAFFIYFRKNQILRVFEDRAEVRTKFLVEGVRRIEASKIEAVNVADALLGQKAYGSVMITGSGGTKIMINPIGDQHKVAEIIRGISSASSSKSSASAATSSFDDLAAQLKNLADLHKSGVLDDKEYKAAKAKLIS
jgi:uncharacterized membrane protein